ncbi:hypothetical protein J4434_03620 [Candidatus Woesearchaeota archaeon]|nr:hypothetical protein [Candidatus Woesearchaeota archaeon]
MSFKLIVTKLNISNKKFITSHEIKDYCRVLNLDYYYTIRYLTHYRYLIRIFKGIFYIPSIEERKFDKTDMNYFEIIKNGLIIKGVKKWYFGLETALKLNNMTHEYFTIDYVVNDSIFRAKPITILGHKVKFIKLTPKLVSFGIKENNINYSNPEKTILDMFYLKRCNKTELLELSEKLSKTKLVKYSKYYSKKVKKIVKELYSKYYNKNS